MRLGYVRVLAGAVAVFLAGMPVLAVLTAVVSQAGSEMSLDTDLEEIGVSGIAGSGKITWKLNGQPAQDLRKMMIQKYDVVRGDANGNLDSGEIEDYKNALDSYLMDMQYHAGTCEDCHGQGPVSYFGAEITAAQLYHYGGSGTSMGQAIQVDMKGLLNSGNASTDDIAIYYKVEVRTGESKQTVSMDSDAFANALYAPFNQTYIGAISQAHLQVLVGFLSYQDIQLPKGSIFMLRTPAGEAIWYKSSFDTSRKGEEHITLAPFDFFENPQILFVLMILVGHYTTAIPHMLYYRFRGKLPKNKQSLAQRFKWIHWMAIIFVLLQIVFYFIPSIGPFFFSGLLYWIFSIGLLGCASGVAYNKYFKKEMPRILALPVAGRPAVIPTTDGARIVVTPIQDDRTEVMCFYCGSLLRAPAAVNPESILCKECNMPQMNFNTGYSHILLEDDPKPTYRMLAHLLKAREHRLYTSATFPEKMMREYSFNVESSIWLTDSGTAPNAINPLRLEFEITRDITKFVKGYPDAVILIDGVNYLIMTNGFEKVFRFVKKLIDLASTSNALLIVVLSKKTLSEEQVDSLCREFDKCIDMSLLVKGEVVQRGKQAPMQSPAPAPAPRPVQASPGGVITPTERMVIPGPSKGPPPPRQSPAPQQRMAPSPAPAPQVPAQRQPTTAPPPRQAAPSPPAPRPGTPPPQVQMSKPTSAQPVVKQPAPESAPPSREMPVQPSGSRPSSPPPMTTPPSVQATYSRPVIAQPSARPQPTPAPAPHQWTAPAQQSPAPKPMAPPPKPQAPVAPTQLPPRTSQPVPAVTRPQPSPEPVQRQAPRPEPAAVAMPVSQPVQRPSVQPQAQGEPRPEQAPPQTEAPKITADMYKPMAITITASSSILQEEEPPSPAQPAATQPPEPQTTTEPKDAQEGERPTVDEAQAIPEAEQGPRGAEGQQQPVAAPTPSDDRRGKLRALLEKKKEQRQVNKVILSTASTEVYCTSCMDKIQVDDWMIICACGAKYHTKCASGSPSCLNCGASLSPS